MNGLPPLVELPNGDQSRPIVHVQLERSPMSFGYDLFIFGRCPHTGKVWMAKPIEFVPHEHGAITTPVMNIDDSQPITESCLQELMDQMWSKGMRPTELRHHAPIDPQERVALKEHIADLRYIMRRKKP